MGRGENFEFLQARMLGLYSRFFLNGRIQILRQVRSLPELWELAIGTPPPALPESALVEAFERQILQTILHEMLSLAEGGGSQQCIIAMLRRIELMQVKHLLHARCANLPQISPSVAIPGIHLDQWPDIHGVLRNTPYAWIDEAACRDPARTEQMLDTAYYRDLWEILRVLSASRRGSVTELLRFEIATQNLVWAMRLRKYFGHDAAHIQPLLVPVPDEDSLAWAGRALANDIMLSSSATRTAGPAHAKERWIRHDSFSNRIEDLVREGPIAAEAAVQQELLRRCRKALHFDQCTLGSIYAFFQLYLAEFSLLAGCAEALRLHAGKEDMMRYIWPMVGGAA